MINEDNTKLPKRPDLKPNEHMFADLVRFRDELILAAFDENGMVDDPKLAEVVYKINSCLYRGYPRRRD